MEIDERLFSVALRQRVQSALEKQRTLAPKELQYPRILNRDWLLRNDQHLAWENLVRIL